jgi:Flp pilus assembly protein TadD
MEFRMTAVPLSSSRPKTVSAHPAAEADAAALARVAQLLDAGRPDEARAFILRHKPIDPVLNNALGVCLLRLGQTEAAMKMFRGMALGQGGVALRSDVPDVVKTNFATSLLLMGEVAGCQSALSEVRDESDLNARRLQEAVRKWIRGLSPWQKMNWYLGGQVNKPVTLDFPPGVI